MKYPYIFAQICVYISDKRISEIDFVYLKRKTDTYLADWKNNEKRKPLIVKGLRQIGKTESIKKFAENNYKSVIEINFVTSEKHKTIETGF